MNGAALAHWGRLCRNALTHHRDEINALNVFPVADADTGTNLLATMRAAVRAADEIAPDPRLSSPDAQPSTRAAGGRPSAPDALQASESAASSDSRHSLDSAASSDFPASSGSPALFVSPATAGDVAGAMARAATAGARGNSGIILSQVLRGIAEAVARGPLTAASLRIALRRAAVLVRDALSEPVEGTMLTVLDAAADRAGDCADDSLEAVAVAAADGAAKALGDTPSQLRVLRAAGVVDAGARGLLVLLDALVAATTGQAPTRPEYTRARADAGRQPPHTSSEGMREPRNMPGAATVAVVGGIAEAVVAGAGPAGGVGTRASGGSGEDRPEPAVGAPDVGAAIVATTGASREVSVARPQYEVMYLLADTDERRIAALRESLARLGDSVVVVGDGAETWSAHVHCADAGAAVEAGLAAGTLRDIRVEGLVNSPHAQPGPADRGILAVTAGAGAARLFEDAGAVVLDGEVTADALLSAIRNMPHSEVVVLPNGALPAHELVAVSVAARDGRRDVLMLPSGSMVQGLAALALHDGGRTAADDVFAMSEAAAATRWGALRVAPERALTIVGTCARGDGLGLVGNDVVVIDPDTGAAARTLLDRMLGLGGELVTLLMGAHAPAGLSEELTDHITATFPGVEVITYDGGQAADLVQIGVE
ncbi:DAK2 domain-containing protein [Nocardia transvalensis]|uniref:DAK2 domain-containing protein n=1 Tax=Nocardia transvalensis TaxID=37333 RepID=UPI001FE7BA5E|nr:DAK2 domain-containing protein [Nocardia transvalensis]